MKPSKSLRTLTAVTPLAIAAVLAAAPQAGAAVGAAAVGNPRVLDGGRTLSIEFSSPAAADETNTGGAMAKQVAESLVGSWAGDLVDFAMQNAPQQPTTAAAAPTCRVTTTATDPNGAKGTASATVPAGAADDVLRIPDQTPKTAWGAGDLDHFTVDLSCGGGRMGTNTIRTTLDEDQIATG